tara:strand:- start:7851 stop:8906 length:1056 start_codon:yes stop_codon:yes gene_type:complete
MHYSDLFNKVHYGNQEIFNKKLNWYFDIKNILYQKQSKEKIIIDTNQLIAEYSSLTNLKEKKKKTFFKTKKISLKDYVTDKDLKFKKKIFNSINYLTKKKIYIYFNHFLIQGSLATNDYMKNWSDFDSVGVIKDEIMQNQKKLIRLREILKIFYKSVLKFSKFQHHGIILFSEFDLKNFLPGYLPIEALRGKSLSIFEPSIFSVHKLLKKKKNLSKEILLGRKNYLKNGIRNKCYDHHVFDNKKLSIPLKENEKTLKQLFVHIGFILNIPILFLDAKGKSSHKKKSFKKFYLIIKDLKVVNFIKKHEYLRSNWSHFYENNISLNKKLIKYLGKNYFNNCLYTINYCLKKIN